MNKTRNIKQVKFNSLPIGRAKNTLSTLSVSNTTKLSSKIHLSEIFAFMDNEYPLSDLAELIEKETGGKFTQLTFREILDKIYPDLTISDKIFLIKHIPLSKVGITPYSPLMFLLYLFQYIQSITKEKIFSPSLIFYSLADKLQYSHGMTTIDFFGSLELKPEMEISKEEFYLNYGKKFGLDELENIILFKSVDYNKDGKIKIEDLILVIDSYRNDNLNDKYLTGDISMQNDVNLFKIFLEENFITLDLIYENAEYNYMRYIDIRSFLINEIYNYKRYTGKEDININESIIDNVLNAIKRNEKIFINDLKNYLGEFIFNRGKNINEINDAINLNDKQKYWINKYIDMIKAGKSTPKMIFNLSAKDSNRNVANIIELMRQSLRLFPNGNLSTEEMQNIINSLDINKTGLIEINQYEIIINIIQEIKDQILSKIENGMKENLGTNEKIINLWSKGIKSNYYHLLPAKGNYEVLEQINQDIKNNIIFDEKEKENDINIININEPTKKKIKKNNFIEQKLEGDKGAIYEEINEKTGKKERFYTNDKDLTVDKIEDLNEYSEENLLKIALENYNFQEIYFFKEDLLSHLIKNKIERKMAEETVNYLDNNENEKISVVSLFKFLLYEMKYKSSKIVLKYLYLKIYKDLKYKSTQIFFKNNKFNPSKKIKLRKLCSFFETFYIDNPLTMKLYDILEYIYKPPILYAHLCQLIDDCKNHSINGQEKDENTSKIISFDINSFDKELKSIVRNLVEINELDNTDIKRCKNLLDQINEMLSDLNDDLTYTQFSDHFAKKLNMSTSTQDVLFNLLKHTPNKGEKQQLISKKDLITFLESYACEGDKTNNIIKIKNDSKNNNSEENEGLSISQLKNYVKKIEDNYPPFRYAFESIPFRTNGLISSTELIYIMNLFYNNSIPKKVLIDIIFCLDDKKEGIISFSQLQFFLNNFSEKNNFSPLLEIEIIAIKLFSKNFFNAMKYFKKFKKIENYKEIKINNHKKILKNLCSNSKNMENLYNYLTEENKKNYYNINNLANKIEFFLKEKNEELILEENELNKNDEEDEEENLGMPDIPIIEDSLRLINLGAKGYISLSELLLKMKKGFRKSFSEEIDKNKIGYISFPEFIKKCRKIYGTEINLNYKLCAQYLYKAYILEPKLTKNFVLKKANQKNINSYLDKKDVYNNFMFAFCNDKFLFENFYNVYCEKKGKYKNKLNLNSLLLFIYSNNPELKMYENNLRFNNDNKEKIDLSIKNIKIRDILEKKLTSIREIIEKINFKSSKLQKNFSISEKYIKSLLETHFNFNEDDADELCSFFQLEEGRFNLKKFFEFDKKNKRNIPIILEDDIIPRIQAHISKSVYKSYREYKNYLFKNDFLDICELYLIFNKLYNLSLYHCLVIIIGSKEEFLSIDKFFKETNLKNNFPNKELEPALILAIVRLNEFIEENYKNQKNDKLKIFKGFDINKDGILSIEEFFNALNSIEGLNLNESQKHKLYDFADANKDGKINAKEFLDLSKNIKNYLSEEEEMNAPLPASYNKNDINNKKYIPKILEKDISEIKANYKFNLKKIKKLKKNTFISCLVNLQLDLIDNYYRFECMENDFLTADKDEEGYVSGKDFKIILQKRIVYIDDKMIYLFVKFSEDDEEKEKEKEEEIDSKNNINNDELRNKKIYYKIFLDRLADYKIKEIKNEDK